MRSLPASEVPAVVACGTDALGAAIVRCLAAAGHPVSFGHEQVAAEEFGPPLCVVANSSLEMRAPGEEPALDTDLTEVDWDGVIDANLSGAFRLVQRLLPGMIDKGYGRVVFVGSVASLVGRSGRAAYSASAAGLEGLVRSLAVEVAPHDVIVNAVAPGYIDDASAGLAEEHERKQFVSSTALRRAGTVDEVAEAVRFLCSSDVSAVTGSVLRVDGGLTA